MQNQLDPSVVALSKAIGLSESGGDYKARGKSGEYGAYQYTKPTWQVDSQKYLGSAVPLEGSTPAQQDEVIYKKIQDLGKQGYKPAQIASIHNSGKPQWEGNVGTNKYGVHFDTPAYVKSVGSAYDRILKGQAVGQDPNNPSAAPLEGKPNGQGFITSTNVPDVPQNQPQENEADTSIVDSIQKKHYGLAALKAGRAAGDAVTFGGASVLGKSIGSLVKVIGNKATGNEAGYNEALDQAPSIKDTSIAALKTAPLVVSGLVSSALNPLKAKEIAYNIPMEMSEFDGLSKVEKLNVLGEALKTAEAGDATKIAAAIKYLGPSQSFIAGLLKSGFSLAKSAAFLKIFGDTAGPILHKITE